MVRAGTADMVEEATAAAGTEGQAELEVVVMGAGATGVEEVKVSARAAPVVVARTAAGVVPGAAQVLSGD